MNTEASFTGTPDEVLQLIREFSATRRTNPTANPMSVLFEAAIAIERLQGKVAAMDTNADLLGACLRGDWSNVDGRHLQSHLSGLASDPDMFASSIGACRTCRSWEWHCNCGGSN